MKAKSFFITFIAAILLSACAGNAPASPTPDVYAIHTAAAETVIAELTQTAAVNSPTPVATNIEIESPPTTTIVPTSAEAFETETPIPSETPTLLPTPTIDPATIPTEQLCDDAAWVADISVQDGTEMSPGQQFEKTWRIKNTGTCAWVDGYHLVFGYDQKMNGQARALPGVILPEETVEVVVVFTAPFTTGEYKSYWRMANTAGINFGSFFYAEIVVR